MKRRLFTLLVSIIMLIALSRFSSAPTQGRYEEGWLGEIPAAAAQLEWCDNFSSSTLDQRWSWVRENSTHWSLTAREGYLRIIIEPGDIYAELNDASNLLLQQAPEGDFTITTRVTIEPDSHAQQAGLLVYQDDDNYIRLTRGFMFDSNRVESIFEWGGSPTTNYVEVSDTTVYLAISRRGNLYTSSYSLDGITWNVITEYPNIDFNQPRVGIGGWTSGTAAPEIPVDFDFFCIAEEQPTVDLSISSVKPIQVVENADINNDGQIDLVLDKPMVVRVGINVSNAESLTPEQLEQNVEVELNFQGSILTESRTINELLSGPVDFFLTPGDFGDSTILVTVDPGNLLTEKIVSVKPVRDISLIYFSVIHLGPTPQFAITVENSGDYVQAVFPVAPNRFENQTSIVPYFPNPQSFIPIIGAPNDAQRLWLQGKLSTLFQAERVVGIVPKRWFSFHLLNAEGVVFPMVSEVAFVLDGAPLTTAHELGHTYGFGEGYILRADDTCCQFDGIQTSGYWVQRQQEIRDATDYMGSLTGAVPYPDQATGQWTTADNFVNLFQQFRTLPNDPEVLLVTGTIDRSGTVLLGPTYRGDGTVSQPPPGDAAVQVLDIQGNIVQEVPFAVDFRILARPIVGTTPPTTVDPAPFAFAVPYPTNAAQLQIVRDGQVLAQVAVTTKLLRDAIASIPDVGFVKNPEQRRNALQEKVDELDALLASGELTEAANKLRNDIRKHLVDWLVDDYATQTPLEYTKPAILELVDELLQRLEG